MHITRFSGISARDRSGAVVNDGIYLLISVSEAHSKAHFAWSCYRMKQRGAHAPLLFQKLVNFHINRFIQGHNGPPLKLNQLRKLNTLALFYNLASLSAGAAQVNINITSEPRK